MLIKVMRAWFVVMLLSIPAFGKIKKIDLLESLDVNGSRQWVLYRSENIDKPVVLFVHGGPASPLMLFSRGFDESLLKDFVVVHWDQRQSGKSYDPNQNVDTFSTAQVAKDGLVIVDKIKHKFGKSKILLVGHSWGSIVGAWMVTEKPKDFLAYVSVGTVSDMAKADLLKYDFLQKKITKDADPTDGTDLKKLGPPPWKEFEQIVILSRLMTKYKGSFFSLSKEQVNASVEKNTEYTPVELKNFDSSMGKVWHQIFPFISSYKAEDTIKKIDVPVYFAQGSHDMATPAELSKIYFDQLLAPKGKEWVEFSNSAHFPMYEEPSKFLSLLKRAAHSK